MLALILAAALNSAPAARTEDAVMTAIFVRQAERAETARLGAWLDSLDGVRIRAAARYSPFADDEPDASPFEVTP
jgi:hypothetical protein